MCLGDVVTNCLAGAVVLPRFLLRSALCQPPVAELLADNVGGKYALEQPMKCVDVVAGAGDALENGDGFIFRRRTQLGDPNTAACSAFKRVDAAPVASL